jgi:tripartite ATP-independent transporter DctM subunit
VSESVIAPKTGTEPLLIPFPEGRQREVDALDPHLAVAPRPVGRRWVRRIDRSIGWIVDPISASLILVEIILLAAGVFARYVLHDAITWSDELARVLFLWLTMFGAVSAYRRNEHMYVNVLLALMTPARARICDVLATMLIAAFSLGVLIAVLWPDAVPETAGLQDLIRSVLSGGFFESSYIGQEALDILPATQMPRSIAVAGIVAGLGFILLVALLRLIESAPRVVCGVAFAMLLACLGAYFCKPVFVWLGNANLVVFFVVFVGLQISIGIPIAFAFGIATLAYLAAVTTVPLSLVAGMMNEGMSNPVLLAIPLFVFLGLLIESTGIARRLIDVISAFVGHYSGGLNIVLVAAMFLVSGISGSKLADMAAVTPVLFPEMERRGYKRNEMIALLSTSGAMAELIPPSLVLIIIGTVCNLSIQALFTGGLLPALVTSICLVAVSLMRSRRERPAKMPKASASVRWKALVAALPCLALPLLIRYFVVAGIATATEVSTIGVIYSLLVGTLVYREFDWRRVYPMLGETARLTGAIMLIISMATAMAWALTQSGFASTLSEALSHAPGGLAGFIALSILLFIVLGSILEGIPAIVLFGPLLFPIAKQLGMNEVHYAVIAVLAMSIGLFSPPFGVGYYGACAVGKCAPDAAALAILPYVVALIVALIVIAVFPWLTIGFL